MVTISELASSDSEDSSTEESVEEEFERRAVAKNHRSSGKEREEEARSSDNYESEDDSDDSETDSDESSHASGDGFDDESDNDDDEEDLRHLPLGERLKRQLEQGNGKARNLLQQSRKANATSDATNDSKKGDRNESKKKKSKHAPTEASSRRRDFYLRQQFHKFGSVGTSVDVHAHRYKPRDPREMLPDGGAPTGPQHPEDYAFLQEMRTKEIATLQRRLQARKLTGNRGQEQRKRYGIRHDDAEGLQQDQKELHRLLQEKAAFERQQLDRAAQQAVRANLKAAAGESTAARKYRPKQRELNRMHMEAKYDLLQERKGGAATIDQILQKKRKKQKSKHSKMPSVL